MPENYELSPIFKQFSNYRVLKITKESIQVGNRDSEVCLVFNDIIKEKSMMNGKPYQAGKFAKSLRMQCMKVRILTLL